jgi:hypothetical protein
MRALPSFPRKRESTLGFLAKSQMDSRLRGNDGRKAETLLDGYHP